jgi:serine/threonine-protein kinase
MRQFPAVDENRESLSDLRTTLETSLGNSYMFERELGSGGMSRVFLAKDRTLQRRVVVKVLKEDAAAGVSINRFRREIQLAANLQHPHIVPLLSSGEVLGTPYFTMPFIDGESLRARLARDGELPVSEAVRILRHVAAALSYAHKQGVVHRDIKPDNVMLADEFAMVTDFGVAKAISASTQSDAATNSGELTGVGFSLGTPAYMSPEQVVADPGVDHRADIYSWGVMAYEMLSGRVPFSGTSPQATLVAHAVQKPDPIQTKRPELPAALSNLVMRCLEKRPDDRPATAAAILSELDAIPISTGSDDAASLVTGAKWSLSRRILVTIAALTILIGAVGYLLYRQGASTSLKASDGELSSVAVLPLVNVGGDTATEYFSDGMTDDLANALGKLPGLRVASRTSAYAFKGRKDASVATIGRNLNVQAILEGTVRRAGDRLRVTAQLTKVADGLTLWSDQYDRQANDLFQVQDEIARSIADALKLKLGARAAELSSTSRGTQSLEAHELYLRGNYFWTRRGADNLLRALSYFERAVANDPNFGRAYAGIALAYALLPEVTDSPPADVLERTQLAANRALSIDPSLAEAHTALGLASLHAWDFRDAEKQYRLAIRLQPRYATAHQWYGELLFRTGRLDSSIAEIKRATVLDPLAPIPASALSVALNAAGRHDEAIAQSTKAMELAPTSGLIRRALAFGYLFKKSYADAVREMEISSRIDSSLALRKGQLAYVYGSSGDKVRARAILDELRQRAKSEKVSAYAFAMAEMGIGATEAALGALERAVDEHDIGLASEFVFAEKVWNPVRANPRFARILERLNLAEYSRVK